MCLQGTILKTLKCLVKKGSGNYTIWLTFQGAGGLLRCYGALETGICSETGERSFSVGQLWGAGKWMGRAGFKGVCPVASRGPMLWNSQHHHLRILKSWIRTPLCTRPCKLYMWDCVQALERGRFGFKFWYSLAIDRASASLSVKRGYYYCLLRLDVRAKSRYPAPGGLKGSDTPSDMLSGILTPMCSPHH